MPRDRRRALRWPFRLFLLVASACIALLLLSLRKAVVVGLSGYGLILTDGGVWVIHRPDFERPEFATTDADARLDWWPPFAVTRSWWRGNPAWSLDARLWFVGAIGLAGAGVCALAPRLTATRRRRAGRCPWCAFDLSGTPASAPCPECGRAR